MTTAINHRIISLRDRAGWSQRKLSKAANISQPTLCRIEAGDREPRLDEVLRIAAALGVNSDALLEEDPLDSRVVVAHRAGKPGVDAVSVRSKLISYLEMDDYLKLHEANA